MKRKHKQKSNFERNSIDSILSLFAYYDSVKLNIEFRL